jgi:3-phosphoshikimate 1-carboxyvinyltransferase
MQAAVRRPARLEGQAHVPGDKSISHRALILNAVAAGPAQVRGLSSGADVASTAACLRELGVEIEPERVNGVGLGGLKEPARALECGNSGTTMRLLAGLLAAQPFESVLSGDESLSRRPMDRVMEPLWRMGARATWPPLLVGGGGPLKGTEHHLSVASAQVKSALLLAGMYAEGETVVVEAVTTRNHTETMLEAMGAPVSIQFAAATVRIRKTDQLRPLDLTVPGDLSAAVFWLVAAGLHPQARVTIPGVGLNASRTQVLDVLNDAIGIRVLESHHRSEGGEPVADLEVGTATDLRPFEVRAPWTAWLIDELPALAVAATQLPGRSRITEAGELRVKESDRIAAMAAGLRALGARVRELDDGWEIDGPSALHGARVQSRGDHRVAMALAVAGLLASGETVVEGAECAAISYPSFWDDLQSLCR